MGNISGETCPNEGYLFMNNSTDSKQTPSSTNSQTDSGNFDFQFSPKLRKVDEETNNSVEMRPMLDRSSPNPRDNQVQQQVNGFSNPNYQNPPVIKCSDLDDIPIVKTSRQYINVSDSSSGPALIREDEPHYVNPKNNTRYV